MARPGSLQGNLPARTWHCPPWLNCAKQTSPCPTTRPCCSAAYTALITTRHHTGFGATGASVCQRAKWLGTGHYLAGGEGDPDDPRVSPLQADLRGLPPLLLTGAELDPLFDDSVALARKLAHSESAFVFHRYAGVNHGFMQMGGELPEAWQAFVDAGEFLRGVAFAR